MSAGTAPSKGVNSIMCRTATTPAVAAQATLSPMGLKCVTHTRGFVLQVLARGEKIELLVDKCDDLQHQAQQFHKQGKQLRNNLW